MAFSLTWLAQVLKDAGLKVAEQPGWQSRGRGPMGNVKRRHLPPYGRPEIGDHAEPQRDHQRPAGPRRAAGAARPGPRRHLVRHRRRPRQPCRRGAWKGITAGNTSFIGIEAENQGIPADPWPAVQVESYKRGCAAILKKLGAGVDMCIGHKEWAPRRKIDPSFDMKAFRDGVAAIMGGTAPAPAPIPAKDGESRPTLRRGASGDEVKIVQARVGVDADGSFGPATEAAVRQFQRDHGLVPDGIVGPLCWAAIIKGGPVKPTAPAAGRPTLRNGDRGDAVKIVQRAVGVHDDGIFGPGTEAAVRAFQRGHGLDAGRHRRPAQLGGDRRRLIAAPLVRRRARPRAGRSPACRPAPAAGRSAPRAAGRRR